MVEEKGVIKTYNELNQGHSMSTHNMSSLTIFDFLLFWMGSYLWQIKKSENLRLQLLSVFTEEQFEIQGSQVKSVLRIERPLVWRHFFKLYPLEPWKSVFWAILCCRLLKGYNRKHSLPLKWKFQGPQNEINTICTLLQRGLALSTIENFEPTLQECVCSLKH